MINDHITKTATYAFLGIDYNDNDNDNDNNNNKCKKLQFIHTVNGDRWNTAIIIKRQCYLY